MHVYQLVMYQYKLKALSKWLWELSNLVVLQFVRINCKSWVMNHGSDCLVYYRSAPTHFFFLHTFRPRHIQPAFSVPDSKPILLRVLVVKITRLPYSVETCSKQWTHCLQYTKSRMSEFFTSISYLCWILPLPKTQPCSVLMAIYLCVITTTAMNYFVCNLQLAG